MVLPRRAPPTEPSPLPTHSLLLLLLLAHQHSHGTNPFRDAICSFSDERSAKAEPSFCISLEKLYTAVCRWDFSILLYILVYFCALLYTSGNYRMTIPHYFYISSCKETLSLQILHFPDPTLIQWYVRSCARLWTIGYLCIFLYTRWSLCCSSYVYKVLTRLIVAICC